MTQPLNWAPNKMPRTGCSKSLSLMAVSEMETAKKFHTGFPQYTRTPLVPLPCLSENLGISGIYIKDESWRFGLNAFKVLGGSFAIAKYIAQKLGKDISQVDYNALVSGQTKEKLGDITFYTATDGNHGRGVAWAANKLGQKSVVLMPKGSSNIRLQNILNEGAEAGITDLNYDDAVRLATKKAKDDPCGVVIQDTAWEGYEEIPAWIMQGYGTLSLESMEQLIEIKVNRPTHIFVQAGVGSFAASVIGYFANLFPDNPPIMTVVEASAADCLYRSNLENKLVNVSGTHDTIMAGLACGEACTIAWDIIKNHANFFVSAPDWVSKIGMKLLAAPLKTDTQIVSGESGAVTAGLLYALLCENEYANFKEALKLNADSNVLLISTEGDTDPVKYKEIMEEPC